MRVTTPRTSTPVIAAGLAAALVAAYLATTVGSFPTLGPPSGSGRAADDAPPPGAADQGAPGRRGGTVETMALDPRPGTGLGSTPLIDEAGRLWVGHHADVSGEVLLSVCPDVRCETSQRITLASGHASYGLDLTLAPGGVAASYVELEEEDSSIVIDDDPAEHHVAVVTCADACSRTVRRVLAGPLPRVTTTAITVDDIGRPLVAYRGATGDLVLDRCLDTSCSVWESTSLAPMVGSEVELLVSSAGSPIVASRDEESRRLQITFCQDPVCESHRTVALGDEGGGVQPSLALTDAGELLVSHATADGLELVWCGTDCELPARRLVARGADVGTFSTIALDGDLPVVSFYDDVQQAPVLLRCGDAACRESTSAAVDDRRLGGEQLGMVLTDRGLPVLTYQHGARDDSARFLRLTRCASPECGSAQQLSTTSPIEIVTTSTGPVAVYLDGRGTVRAVACGGTSSCADAPTRVLDTGGTPPVEAVAALGVGLDGLALATRSAGDSTATVQLCATGCADDLGALEITGVARLLALHATGSGVAVLHVDLGGNIASAHCTTDGCDGARLLGTPGAHATIAATATEHTAVAWHDPLTGDVWAVRCDGGCDAAPRPVGTWPEAGDLHVAATTTDLVIAVELVQPGATHLARCRETCTVINTVPGRPLGLLADDATVTLLAAEGHSTFVHVCNGRCTTTDTGLDAGLMTPTLVSVEPLRLLGRDGATMNVVTRHCDRRGCDTEGLGSSDGGGSLPGIE